MGLFSSAPVSHFPIVKGKRLDGTAVRFPDDLPADATLLILSFQDDRDPLSDQWARLAERIADVHEGRFSVLEVPVVSIKLKLLGGFATMGIRGQVEGDDEHARTVPIFVDVKPFQRKLKVKSNGVYPILVARDGRIAWRGEDHIDMDEVEELEAAVQEVLAAPIPSPTDHPDADQPDDLDGEIDGEIEDPESVPSDASGPERGQLAAEAPPPAGDADAPDNLDAPSR